LKGDEVIVLSLPVADRPLRGFKGTDLSVAGAKVIVRQFIGTKVNVWSLTGIEGSDWSPTGTKSATLG